MNKDLTNSKNDRQNILNNDIAISELRKEQDITGVMFEEKLCFTKEMIAQFYGVETRTIERYTADFQEELKANGYEIVKGNRLKIFISNLQEFAPDINVSTKITQLGIYDFRTFLNIGMFL